MDEVITRIVEIERQCSAAVEQAEQESAKHLEEHKRVLEDQKANERTLILAAENSRRTQTINEAKRKAETFSSALMKERESLFQDQSLNKAIKEDIISILFEG